MSKCKSDKKWTKKDLEALLKDGAARLVPASWTKRECWTRFRCVEVGNEISKSLLCVSNVEYGCQYLLAILQLCKDIMHHTQTINVDPGQFKMTSFLPKKSE
ncbi:hypothetical protein Bpfe_002700, partial [Biomphalaria pfeifferi]